MKRYINITLLLLFGLAVFTSCESLLDVDPEEVVLSDDYLGDSELDARSALFGVLSQMQELTGQYVVLGELRADLVNVNSRTADELRQISKHEVEEGNSYSDPTALFAIINNCNFAIEGIDTEAYENLLLDDYASILRIRVWAQMQILIHYGKLPYITEPIRTNDDLEKNYPLLTINEAIDQLILDLQPITGVENVTKYENSLGFNIFKMIPNQDILLGDLNLWKGNYVEAAIHYKQFLDDNVSGGGNFYNLTSQYGAITTQSGGNYNVRNNWENIYQENIQNNVVINYVAFDDQYRQPNSAFSILMNEIKPSALAILKWGAQFKAFEGERYELGDNRAEASYEGEGDLAIITKYQYEYFVWNRVVKIYLRYAEAINYAGFPDQALTIVNGIFNNPGVEPKDAPIFDNDEGYLNFDVDQYFNTNSSDEPISGNLGVRGRVSMEPVTVNEDLTEAEKIEEVGMLILEEAALELAFEGNRWEDLMRFALRSNDASILANAVADKFETSGDDAGAAAIQAKLMNPENWFLPLTIPSNFSSGN
ncbi:SusD-like starch-binding protein associating with outer membrane [Jejuia pallidilutea]|uniref:SusD-like starch-binding protein associating with outer membrane n=1 Tax=Jejuia pallidilutea TaxID=504487 RepID=A0A362XCW0_9FLAO|nr:RagB/SusD family nutrient uptake outer membrane protein [Jejuia pallidilutea]PQV48953.1 SusD-like starch-binding protein associating with outer membrane [Jejuia pallidilutea]